MLCYYFAMENQPREGADLSRQIYYGGSAPILAKNPVLEQKLPENEMLRLLYTSGPSQLAAAALAALVFFVIAYFGTFQVLNSEMALPPDTEIISTPGQPPHLRNPLPATGRNAF